MTAAVWSTSPDKCTLLFPAKTLVCTPGNLLPNASSLMFSKIQFMYNHHLLQLTGKPAWLTIQGGRFVTCSFLWIPYSVRCSKVYVDRIVSEIPRERIHLCTPVSSLKTLPDGGVELKTANGQVTSYDHVILACHSDMALNILRAGSITDEEDRILSKFRWNTNEAVLHSDIDVSGCFAPLRRLILTS